MKRIKHSKTQNNRGFTLVELLVVISVIAVLIGLLFSALQAAREAARRMQCQSNLKQLGLAAINFESAHRRFPTGGWGYQWQGFSDINSIAGQPGSWTYSLLPMIEQSTIYQLGSFHSSPQQRNSDLRKRIETSVAIFNCPSRRSSAPIPFRDDCQSCRNPIGVTQPLAQSAKCDYAINAGDGSPDLTNINSWPLNYWGPENVLQVSNAIRNGSWPKPPQDWSGISWFAQSVRLGEISDGTSNTFLMGEKYVRRDAYYDSGDWGDNEPLFGGFNNDNHRGTHPYWPILKDATKKQSIGSFGSSHNGGVNFVLTDGSVTHVSYSIDSNIYRLLGNRHDGMNAQVPE
jgi:prepilin-type N-terminal cleavage/methylation domain-containing protein/prepilin-type processing-associated H-X9-DG protein